MNNEKQIIETLDQFSKIEHLDETNYGFITSFEKNGMYCLVNDDELRKMPMDTRWYAKWHSTYHALALLIEYYLKGHREVYGQLRRCFDVCIEHEFAARGFNRIEDELNILFNLLKAGILEILDDKPGDAEKFARIINRYRRIYKSNKYLYGLLCDVLKIYDRNVIFVYGTLMKGMNNHKYLKDNEYIDDAYLYNYGLLELGYFPGAVKAKNYKVCGELYRITDEEKININNLEGSLYDFKHSFFDVKGKTYYAGFYEYITDWKEYELRKPYGKWNTKPLTDISNYVWYVCYGSNLKYERFMKYIENCTDKSEPICREIITIPYELYFAEHSERWNGAKAFIDLNQRRLTFGAKYLITKEQYEQIKNQEGSSYRTNVDLGEDKFGIKQVSFTQTKYDRDGSKPSQEYINVIRDGLKENYGFDDLVSYDYIFDHFENKENNYLRVSNINPEGRSTPNGN